MIDGIEQLYQEIAEAMLATIPEEWSSAKYEAIFFASAFVFEAEYTRAVDGKARSFLPLSSGDAALRQLRQLFKDAGKPLWGRVCFALSPDGATNVAWGYDQCDANGDAIFDEDAEFERADARRRRLTQP
jgi:hypothetical protein